MLDASDIERAYEASDPERIAHRNSALRRNGALAECVGSGLVVELDGGPARIELAHWTLRRGADRTGAHRHPWWELTWLLRGRLRLESEAGEAPVQLGPGEGFVAPPELTHRWQAASERLVMFGLMVDRPGHAAEATGGPIHLAMDPGQRAAVGQLAYEARRRRAHFTVVTRGWLEVLLGLAVRSAATEAAEAGEAASPGRSIAHAARGFIQQHLGEALSPELIAGQFDISTRHLNRLIGEHFGCSTRQLIQDLRLRRAFKLIGDRSRSIKRIALMCGFRDPDYFSRVFTRAFGHPPSAYRRDA